MDKKCYVSHTTHDPDEVIRKRVTLHPIKSDGTMDTEVNLYPKVFLDGIVDRNGNPVDIQTLLVAGENITIENGVISAAGNLKTTEIDLSSLMSQEEILSLVHYLAGLDEELEKEFLFSELIHVSDYLEYSQIKLQYSLLGGEPSGIILNKKYETEGNPQFIYEDLEAGITLKLFDGGLTASRAIPVDAYTKEESDAKYQIKLNNENKLPASYIDGLADVAYTGKTSSLDNDSGFATETYVDTEVEEAIAGLGTVFTIKESVATVADLPTTGNTLGDVRYVADEYASYVWVNLDGTEQWQQLGSSIDLDDYVTQEDFNTALSTKQDFPPITTEENYYLRVLYPVCSTAALEANLTNLDVDFVKILIGEIDPGEPFPQGPHQYLDNFGEAWTFEATSENTADIAVLVGTIEYKASVSIEVDVETGESTLYIDTVYAENIAAKSDIPTSTSQLINDSGFITSAALSEYATLSVLSSAVSDINSTINSLSSVYAPVGDYTTNTELSSAISALSSVYASQATLSNYATTTLVSSLDYASVNALSSTTFIPSTYSDIGALSSGTVIPAAQVSVDWNASSGISAILNKPNLSEYGKVEALNDSLVDMFGYMVSSTWNDVVVWEHLGFSNEVYSALYSLSHYSESELARQKIVIYTEDMPVTLSNFTMRLSETMGMCELNYYGTYGRLNGILIFVFTSNSCALDFNYGVHNFDISSLMEEII